MNNKCNTITTNDNNNKAISTLFMYTRIIVIRQSSFNDLFLLVYAIVVVVVVVDVEPSTNLVFCLRVRLPRRGLAKPNRHSCLLQQPATYSKHCAHWLQQRGHTHNQIRKTKCDDHDTSLCLVFEFIEYALSYYTNKQELFLPVLLHKHVLNWIRGQTLTEVEQRQHSEF